MNKVSKETRQYMEENKAQIINEYLEDVLSVYKIAAKRNLGHRSVKNFLIQNGVKIRRSGKRSSFNEDYFEEINTEAKAYFLGLLLADGCVNQGSKKGQSKEWQTRIILELQNQDKHILESFREELNLNIPVHKKKTRNNHAIYLASTKMANDLLKLNMTQRKSLTCKIPQINDNLVRHLLRGMWDGDGWLSVQKGHIPHYRWGFCGSKDTCTAMKEILDQQLGNNNLVIREKENIFVLDVSNRNFLLKLFIYFFEDSGLFLIRKRQKFVDFISDLNIRYENNSLKFKDGERDEFLELMKKALTII